LQKLEIWTPLVLGWELKQGVIVGKLAWLWMMEERSLRKPVMRELKYDGQQRWGLCGKEIREISTSGSSIGPPQMAQYMVNSSRNVIFIQRVL